MCASLRAMVDVGCSAQSFIACESFQIQMHGDGHKHSFYTHQ
jgi:hypothetical protein